MEATRLSLLGLAQSSSEAAWNQLYEIYQPLIYGWLRRHGVTHEDAEELSQDTLLVVARELPDFTHSGRRGAFRRWIFQIAANRARNFWRQKQRRPRALADDHLEQLLEQLDQPASELSQSWHREHDRFVVRRLFERIASDFHEKTLFAFRRLMLDGASASEVANELDMTVGAVYSAKSGVLRRLRQDADGLIDDAHVEILFTG